MTADRGLFWRVREWSWDSEKIHASVAAQEPACLLCTASGEKKEGWSWESYLEEQKAITAPVSLFQDVSWAISTWEELVFPARDSSPYSDLLVFSL